MQYHTTNQLHVEMAHIEHPLTGFTHSCKGFRQDVIQSSAGLNPLLKFAGFFF